MTDHTKQNHDSTHGADNVHHHHILPDKIALTVGAILLCLTALTVWVAGIDFGEFNLLVALGIATAKGLLVCLFFMNLLYDKRENGVIFGTSFLFLGIFIVLTGSDFFFRGDVYVKNYVEKQAQFKVSTSSAPKFKKPWVTSPELVAHGKEEFKTNCVSCHGVDGKGDGVAAASLNPKPRNFHVVEGWKNGRTLTEMYKTLSHGLGGMPSFASLTPETRLSLIHYIQTDFFTSPAAQPTDAELIAVGINPKDEYIGAAQGQKRSVPVNIIINDMVEESAQGG